MAEIRINKYDVIWSFLGKGLLSFSGFITLPLVLRLLTVEEIALNYLMMTIASLVSLLDFGFTPMFSRNFTYVYSGAHKLLPEGLDPDTDGVLDFHLLSVLIKSANYVYRKLAIICLIIMLTLGSFYIYKVTEGFTLVSGALFIWIGFSISTFFGIYFSFYSCLLVGSGKIKESNISNILSRVVYLAVCITLLLLHCGLASIVIATFISPWVQRYYTYKVFFTKDIKEKIEVVNKDEIVDLFKIIWYNAKKIGFVAIGSYALNKSSMFLIGLYLPLNEVASYGLMIQIFTFINSFAIILYATYSPMISALRLHHRN